ncbi:M3 family peptidase, partial [Cyanobium sp. LEGE 06143]|nr:M3 family peptidase [Cyanobium sp. LEGE 06143]
MGHATATLPLLEGQGLPAFAQITADQVATAIPLLLEQLHSELSALETNLEQQLSDPNAPLAWEAVMEPLQRLGERLRWSWGAVSHLNGVCNSPELREAYQQQQGAVVAFGSRAGQSQVLYRALERLAGSALDGVQRRILEAERRDMQLRGVGLEGTEQGAFNA